MMRKAPVVLVLLLFALFNTACEKGLAYGDPNAVIVAAPVDWWPQVRDSVFAVLSPDVFTLRDERAFRLQYEDPTGPDWGLKRMFKEVVVVGGQQDTWMAEALATLHDTVVVRVPGVVQAEDVWARNQKVSLILVDPQAPTPPQVFSLVGEVHAALDERFREGVHRRMFVSGRNDTLADSLRRAAGFSLVLPAVYRWGSEDSLYVFRNDNPDPSELIRQFAVTWMTPIPDPLSVEFLMDWKEALSQESYSSPQVVDRENLHTRHLALGEMQIHEVRGAWLNPPDSSWPAAGPFILWSVACPPQDRHYLIDAWLYAPGKDKWEYILQMETILRSFRCGTGDPAPALG
jgi:hypothetical protein